MSTGAIVLIIVKTVLAAIPFMATIFLFMYFARPTFPGRPRAASYFAKYMGLFILCFTLSTICAMALIGVFSWKPVIYAILGAIYVVFIAITIKIGESVRERRPDHSGDFAPVTGKSTREGFIDGLFAAREEYSDYYVEEYYRYRREHPNSKYSRKVLASGAVKKNKKNPEAQYILADTYLDLSRLKYAEKHALLAVQLDPGNDKYTKLIAQIEGSSRMVNLQR